MPLGYQKEGRMSIQQEPTPTPKDKHDMTYAEAYRTQQSYVCAGCYHTVVATETDRERGTWTATCATTDCSTPGYVTRSWLKREQEKNAAQAIEARDVLRQAVPWMNPHKGKTDDQLLKELGF